MSKVPAVKQLEQVCGGEGRGRNEPKTLRFLYARFVRKLSIRVTWLLLHTKVSANQVTVLGILVGIGGAAALTQNNFWAFIVGALLLQLSFVIDFSDGEVARYYDTGNAGGAYLDWVGHYYVPAAAVAAITYSALVDSGHEWLLLAGFVLILGIVRVAYSARDHVLLGLYRDDEQLRNSPEFVRAVLARQGGDPERVNLDAGIQQRRVGVPGRGFLWRRYTNLGQLLVFPGFVNILTLALAVDVVISLADGHYPDVTSSVASQVLIGGLGIVQVAHQLRAIFQSFAILKRFR